MYGYERLRPLAVRLAIKREGGKFFSKTLRDFFRVHHGVEIGEYAYGGCFKPDYLPRGTVVGRYASVSSFMRVYRRNHPIDRLSQCPIFYHKKVGLVTSDSIDSVEDNPLRIGHDSWIGHEVVITASCKIIGDGAIVGAGAVVTKNVEPFTVVAGNPARVIRRRYPPDVERAVIESRWWERSVVELVKHPDMLVRTLAAEDLTPLIEGRA
ncbi:MAG: CatB-related O-acetyltransferase [Phycisphaeraceae bacterium]|nr:CatB-related O-acetyltransferase [Phycisphaeraceae bacterium]